MGGAIPQCTLCAFMVCYGDMGIWGDLYLYKLRGFLLRDFLHPPGTISHSTQTNVNNCK